MHKPFSQADFTVLSQKVVFEGIFRVISLDITHRLYNGQQSAVLQRTLMEKRPAVAILPYDPLRDEVLLIEQFRVGAMKLTANPWVTEIIAGIIDTDETPENVAIREAKEEAGCDLQQVELIGDYFVSPGGTDEHLYIYCARADLTNAGGFFGLVDENEDIRAFTLSAQTAFDKVQQNEIKTAPATMALLWLQINRPRLRALAGITN